MSEKPGGDDDGEIKDDESKSFSDGDLFIAMTDAALRDDARSASASTIQDEIVKTLHKIEVIRVEHDNIRNRNRAIAMLRCTSINNSLLT